MERQRDLVFCHVCENEWFRDEGGLTCPDCHSDFTEIPPLADSDHQIEAQHDPRHTHDEEADTPHPLAAHNPWANTPIDAPDPEESDLDHNYRYQVNPQGGIHMSFSHTFSNNPRNPDSPPQHVHAQGPDVLRMLGQLLGGAVQTQQRPPQSPDGEPNVRVFTGGGPNFQYTATTRLAPRDANGPQAQNQNIDNLPDILNQMFQAPPRGAGPDPAFAPLGFGNIFANLLNPANMQHGDAVYSQEALDRIISQLMEQNQSNAPGPASAEAISSLPQKEITKEDLDETTGKADCSICMDEALIGSQVTVLPCSHWFHADCIKAWLGEHDTCPHCRQGIMPEDGPENATRPREPGQTARNNRAWGQGEGTREDPINVSESPVHPRTTNADAGPSGAASSAWARMRDAFGGGGGGSNSPSGAS
ncbi:hypothetical protein D6C92_07078 [Aureobasidium pullulans]|nr:hypothetical protein D6C92_07078 [Aureobasidium pullulans]TIA24941.1 hypothetical protein D6C81_02203 [Aureobasidium pullulans]